MSFGHSLVFPVDDSLRRCPKASIYRATTLFCGKYLIVWRTWIIRNLKLLKKIRSKRVWQVRQTQHLTSLYSSACRKTPVSLLPCPAEVSPDFVGDGICALCLCLKALSQNIPVRQGSITLCLSADLGVHFQMCSGLALPFSFIPFCYQTFVLLATLSFETFQRL